LVDDPFDPDDLDDLDATAHAELLGRVHQNLPRPKYGLIGEVELDGEE